MEKPEADKGGSSDEGSNLARNRSFKSKQLVRSQAIRESQSPPRTISPAAIIKANNTNSNESDTKRNKDINETDINNTAVEVNDDVNNDVDDEVANADDVIVVNVNDKVTNKMREETDASSHTSDDRSSANSLVTSEDRKTQQVEIQITSGVGGWEESPTEQRQRTRRWLGHGHHPGHRQHSRDLLSNNPRVACVCGTCAACPHCRGRRRRPICPTKQDSGIVCSDECPDCSDSEHAGPTTEGKASSLDADGLVYCRCPERKEKPKSISRTDSDEKSEPTGLDLVNFIKETLNKNGRDRLTLLRIEKELHALVNDTGRCIVRFPVMTSYGRMLVHRCAALFQLSHHLDQTNKSSVLVSKSGTSGGRIPCTSFKQWCTTSFPASPQRRTPDHVSAKSILKRDAHSLDEPCAGAALAARSRSLEQRERDYERVRNKIFNSEGCPQGEGQWPWLSPGPVRLLTPDSGRNKLIKVQSLEGAGAPTHFSVRRDSVSKSHSFGGYGQPDPPRMLSRQGDLASSSWRLSPSSSGYRTLSLHSTDSVTPSPTGGASPEPYSAHGLGGAVVWAVTDMGAVPNGAMVIQPQTGRPLTNPDGSVYRFDPTNPPVLYDTNTFTQDQHKTDQTGEKKRGRLEKQHSFIDSECTCQSANESRVKCFCDSRHKQAEKVTHSSQKYAQKPSSPCKKRYETAEILTNHGTSKDLSTNHRTAYDSTANHKEDTSYESQNYFSTKTRLDANARQYEPTNQQQEQRTYDTQRPQSYDSPKYEATNQRSFYEPTNHRSKKLTNKESQGYGTHYYGQNYTQAYGHDELSSPPQQPAHAYSHVEQSGVTVPAVTQDKAATLPDNNLRPVSLTNVVFPTLPPGYPYHLRMASDPSMPVYEPPLPLDAHKPVAPSTHGDSTFRIDPSYPYQPVDYSQCDACTATCGDPAIQQRSYAVAYAPVPETHASPYSMSNVYVPQQISHYPYAESVPWNGLPLQVPLQQLSGPRVLAPELYPVLQCPVYQTQPITQTHQVVSQQYQVYPSMYPTVGVDQRGNNLSLQRGKRNSTSGSSRATPLTPHEDRKPYDDAPQSGVVMATGGRNVSRQDSCDIALKIQQIKDQMAQLNTRDRDKSASNPTSGPNPTGPRRDDWKRRNSGNGILGNYPNQYYNGRGVMPGSDDSQLSTAARAIVNSIRNIQTGKGTYPQDIRPDYDHHQVRLDRRRPEDCSRPSSGDHHVIGSQPERMAEDRRDGRRNVVPFQYRPPYILRQMSPGTWCRKSPGPIHPALNHPRRPHPDPRNQRR